MPTPTADTYAAFNDGYCCFNARLFAGALPECLITLQRKNRTMGYFKRAAFADAAGAAITDEIALNPAHFRVRADRETLSTLVHEMVHLWQHHFGKPSRPGYHNAEWADRMEEVGLMPTTTGGVDGKRTGQRVTHYIVAGGPFDTACRELLGAGFQIPWGDAGAPARGPEVKSGKRHKYECPNCGSAAWARPCAELACVPCDVLLREAGESDEGYAERRRAWAERHDGQGPIIDVTPDREPAEESAGIVRYVVAAPKPAEAEPEMRPVSVRSTAPKRARRSEKTA